MQSIESLTILVTIMLMNLAVSEFYKILSVTRNVFVDRALTSKFVFNLEITGSLWKMNQRSSKILMQKDVLLANFCVGILTAFPKLGSYPDMYFQLNFFFIHLSLWPVYLVIIYWFFPKTDSQSKGSLMLAGFPSFANLTILLFPIRLMYLSHNWNHLLIRSSMLS